MNLVRSKRGLRVPTAVAGIQRVRGSRAPVGAAARAASAGWQSQAACLDSDPDLFFPISSSGPALQQIAQAKALCASCPVRRECLRFALATNQVHGVWGGTSEEKRQQLRSRDGGTMVPGAPGNIPPSESTSG